MYNSLLIPDRKFFFGFNLKRQDKRNQKRVSTGKQVHSNIFKMNQGSGSVLVTHSVCINLSQRVMQNLYGRKQISPENSNDLEKYLHASEDEEKERQ